MDCRIDGLLKINNRPLTASPSPLPLFQPSFNPLFHNLKSLINIRHGGKQFLRVRMLRSVANLIGGAGFNDFALIHHGNAVAHFSHHGQIVTDKEIGQAALALEPLQKLDDIRLHRNIERGDRLVGHQQFRFQSQCAGDPDPLALSAAEFVRIADQPVGIETDIVEQRRRGAVRR